MQIEKIRVAKKWGGYNQRRYSRPWIAAITAWPVGGRPELSWGGYAGDDSGGELEIMAAPGDIIRYGQRDGRGNGGSNEWAIVRQDGAISDCTQAEARAHWQAREASPEPVAEDVKAENPLDKISDADLLAEVRRRGLTLQQEIIL